MIWAQPQPCRDCGRYHHKRVQRPWRVGEGLTDPFIDRQNLIADIGAALDRSTIRNSRDLLARARDLLEQSDS